MSKIEKRNHTDDDALAMFNMQNLLTSIRDNTTDEKLKQKLNFNIQLLKLINST